MSTLASELRSELERVVIDAREASETGSRAALEALAAHHKAPYPQMSSALRQLRSQLRAKARQLGDRRLPTVAVDGADHQIDHLVAECAYEQWHRMLFARFLAENGLLIEPQEVTAISLAEAQELAKDEGVDMWVFASRCAQRMLPQIFRPDDPLLQVSFATEHRLKLEGLLKSLSEAVFTASDALGWVYQFWQSKKKAEVNRSEVKIGADEIAAVTQLFTEPYMVEFLLHNTLGAWWAGKTLSADAAAAATSEDDLRRKVALPGVSWDYLRFVRGDDGQEAPWRPAAGTFDGWPKAPADLRVLDPCCGSGHFLVAALHHLVPIRVAEEGLSVAAGVDAVLGDNLHGLEIDERCCQIAAFALALAAWRYPDAGGYRPLPELNIACTGIAPQASKTEWLDLAERAAAIGGMPVERDLLHRADSLLSMAVASTLEALYDLFAQAPLLGSLIAPRRLPSDLFRAEFDDLYALLTEVLKAEVNDDVGARAVAAAGVTKAAHLLVGEYTLVVTNVPYLGLRKMHERLKRFCESEYRDARHDLANVMLDRVSQMTARGGTLAVVTPQAWVFAGSFIGFRKRWLTTFTWNSLARLGSGAFNGISGEVVNVALLGGTNTPPGEESVFVGIDCEDRRGADEKSMGLQTLEVLVVSQKAQLGHPDQRVLLSSQSGTPLLNEVAVRA